MRRTAAYALVLLAGAALSGRAAAAPAPTDDGPAPPLPRRTPPVMVAFAAGIATALIPLALGATYTANASTDGPRDVGYAVAGAGFAMAPIVAHVALGEWKRAAAFGAAPVAAEIAIVSLVSAKPDAIFQGTTFSRTN